MKLLDALERRFGRLGIPNLILYIVAGRGIAFVLSLSNPGYPSILLLHPERVFAGEVWRVATFVLTPPALLSGFFGGPLGALLQLYFTWLIGRALEEAWGSFRFTLFYGLGSLLTALAALFLSPWIATPEFVDLSLFLAFATVFPEFTVLLFFILPVKVKWLGWLSAAGLGLTFLGAPGAIRTAILAALANYLVFFAPAIRLRGAQPPGAGFPSAPAGPIHRCAACGKTEREDRELDFRWCMCPRCSPDGKEFCRPHLEEHLKS